MQNSNKRQIVDLRGRWTRWAVRERGWLLPAPKKIIWLYSREMTHRDSADSSDCHWSAERPNREMTACISCLSPCLRKVLATAVQQIVHFWPFVNPFRKVPLCGGKRYYRWRKQCPQEVRCQAKTSRPDEWRALSFFLLLLHWLLSCHLGEKILQPSWVTSGFLAKTQSRLSCLSYCGSSWAPGCVFLFFCHCAGVWLP